MSIHIFVTLVCLWEGISSPAGCFEGPASPSDHHGFSEGSLDGGQSSHFRQPPVTTPAHQNSTSSTRQDMRWIGARTACHWSASAEEQLHLLRQQQQGAEPLWLAVLHRIRNREEVGYHRWCSGYLRRLRSLFGKELQAHLHRRSLSDDEVQWASRVEQAAYQDFLHHVHGRREAIPCLPRLSTDDVVLASQPAQDPQFPYGISHAGWVNSATSQWGPRGTVDPSAAGLDTEYSAEQLLGEEGDITGLFQLRTSIESRWQLLIEQLHDWMAEGLAAGLAVRMARDEAAAVVTPGFQQWAQDPLHTLGAGIVFSDGTSSETTPTRFRAWATEIVECLVVCYRRELDQGGLGAGEPSGDAVSFMDRDRRHRDGRRRYRDSRSPRRNNRPTCASSSNQGFSSTRAARVAARQAREAEGTRDGGEYVLVHLEEAPNHTRETGTHTSSASGSAGPVRPPVTELVGPTTGAEPPRPTSSGPERTEVVLPHPRRPMTMSQAVDLWRYMLFSRTALGPELCEGERVPNGWLPASLVREICVRHEAMSATNRGISTLALLTVLRFLAQELSQTLQQADTIARTQRVGRRHGEPEEDDEELLLQLGMTRLQAGLADEAIFMQHFVHSNQKMTTTMGESQQRWAQGLSRLQEDLAGMRKDRRKVHIQGLLSALLATGATHGCDWGEQLPALLLVLLDDVAAVEVLAGPDDAWLNRWLEALAVYIPGLQRQPTAILVDSQPKSTSSGCGDAQAGVAVTAQELDKLIQDEAEELERRDAQRREESSVERQRQEDFVRLCDLDEMQRSREAAAFRDWEDAQIKQYLEEHSAATPAKRRCVMQLEVASGSGIARP